MLRIAPFHDFNDTALWLSHCILQCRTNIGSKEEDLLELKEALTDLGRAAEILHKYSC